MVDLPILFRFPPDMRSARRWISRICGRFCTSATALVVVAATIPAPATAQYPDTYMVGGGVLRMSFEPTYANWGLRFDSSGVAVPLGIDLSFDSTSSNFFPTMGAAEAAIWSIVGDTAPRLTAGGFQTQLDADVRRFPFNFRLGLSNKLTFTASIPVVTTRMQVDFSVDSTTPNVGWNQASELSGDASAAIPQIAGLLGQLEASAGALDAIVAGGGLDCPNGPECDAARDLASRARTLAGNLMSLTGVNATGELDTWLPPFAPLASSAIGEQLMAAIQSISLELENLGAPAVTGTLPLPTTAFDADSVGIQDIFSGTFGYNAHPLEFARYTKKLGDLEVGLRYGLLQRPTLRAVLSTTVRLPTGMRDAPDHYVDIGTGDKQMDVEAGLDVAIEPGSVVGIAFHGRYNLQLGDELVRRITSPYNPIAPAITERLVSRNLGDEITVAAFPTLRLSQSFRAYGSIQYFRKQSDAYSWPASDGPHLESWITPSHLETGTAMRSVSLGGGIHFRSSGRSSSLPAEAGIHYSAAYHGSGGFTPKTTSVSFYLRLFRRLFGGPPAESEVEADEVGRN